MATPYKVKPIVPELVPGTIKTTQPIAKPEPPQEPTPVPAEETLPSTEPVTPEPQEQTPPAQEPNQTAPAQGEDDPKNWKDFYVIERDKSMYDSNWKSPSGHFKEDKAYKAFKNEQDAKNNVQTPQVAIHIKCPISVIQRYQDPQNEDKWAPLEGKLTDDAEKQKAYDTEGVRVFELALFKISQNPAWMPQLMEGLTYNIIEGRALSVDEFAKLFT